MGTKEYTKIESVNVRKRNVKAEASENSSLPTSEERRKIVLDMLLKGCYVSDIYQRFGAKCPDERTKRPRYQYRGLLVRL